MKIDSDGIFGRVIALDMPARNYTGLVGSGKNSVFVMEAIPNESGLSKA